MNAAAAAVVGHKSNLLASLCNLISAAALGAPTQIAWLGYVLIYCHVWVAIL